MSSGNSSVAPYPVLEITPPKTGCNNFSRFQWSRAIGSFHPHSQARALVAKFQNAEKTNRLYKEMPGLDHQFIDDGATSQLGEVVQQILTFCSAGLSIYWLPKKCILNRSPKVSWTDSARKNVRAIRWICVPRKWSSVRFTGLSDHQKLDFLANFYGPIRLRRTNFSPKNLEGPPRSHQAIFNSRRTNPHSQHPRPHRNHPLSKRYRNHTG